MDSQIEPILKELRKLNAEHLYEVCRVAKALIKKKRRPPEANRQNCSFEFVSGHARLDKWASCFVSCRQWKLESVEKIVDKGITEKWTKITALKTEGGIFWIFFTQGLGGNRFPQASIAAEIITKSGANACFTPDNQNEYQRGYIKGQIEILRVLRGQEADKVIKLSKENNKTAVEMAQKSGPKSA